MSYARMSKDSDIYLYGYSVDPPLFECSACCLDNSVFSVRLEGFDEAIKHVQAHIDAGDKVEDDVIPFLLADKEEFYSKKRGI